MATTHWFNANLQDFQMSKSSKTHTSNYTRLIGNHMNFKRVMIEYSDS